MFRNWIFIDLLFFIQLSVNLFNLSVNVQWLYIDHLIVSSWARHCIYHYKLDKTVTFMELRVKWIGMQFKSCCVPYDYGWYISLKFLFYHQQFKPAHGGSPYACSQWLLHAGLSGFIFFPKDILWLLPIFYHTGESSLFFEALLHWFTPSAIGVPILLHFWVPVYIRHNTLAV